MTVTVTDSLLRRSPGLLKAHGSFPLRPLRNRYLKRWLHPRPISLRPIPSVSVRDVIAAWRECRRPGNGVGVMMVHSSELMPGASPYRGTPESVERLLADLASFFSQVRASGARMMTLPDAARTLRAARAPAVRAL